MSIRYWLVTAGLFAEAGCSPMNPRVMTRLNEYAALSRDLPADPLRWQVITSGVDSRNATMFTLFGNDTAVHHARSSATRYYAEGSALALVTWQQQEDSRWFGGQIPGRVVSVEFVNFGPVVDGRSSSVYRVYEGFPLTQTPGSKTEADNRAAYVLSLRAAVMP